MGENKATSAGFCRTLFRGLLVYVNKKLREVESKIHPANYTAEEGEPGYIQNKPPCVGMPGRGENATGAEIFNNYEYNTASGSHSHAEGNSTHATGLASHAEGQITVASGDSAHAEGNQTEAAGAYSHAEGRNTVATASCSHVAGRSNIIDHSGKYIHIVGNGDMTGYRRSNAHTIDFDGVGWFAAGLKVGGTGQDDEAASDVLTMAALDAAIEDATPDMAQNDPAGAGYVKNRTHYSEIKEVVVECVGEAGEVELDNFPKFTVGDTVGVIVDDVEHLLVAFDDGGYPTIGDAYDDVMEGIGEFGWYIYVGGDSVCFGAYVAPHTIRYPGKVVEYVWEPGEVLLDNFPEFAVGDTVTVTVDGSEHTLIAFKDYSGPVIGDPIDAVFDGTGELGWFISYGLEGGIWFVALGPHTIRYEEEVVHKLDDKYVPVIPRNRIENGEHLCFDITGYMTDLWLETELSDGSFVYSVDPSVNFDKTPEIGLSNMAYPGIALRGSVGLYFVFVTAAELQVDGIRMRDYVFVHSDAVEEGIAEYKEYYGVE